jgi:hypothetical protein
LNKESFHSYDWPQEHCRQEAAPDILQAALLLLLPGLLRCALLWDGL